MIVGESGFPRHDDAQPLGSDGRDLRRLGRHRVGELIVDSGRRCPPGRRDRDVDSARCSGRDGSDDRRPSGVRSERRGYASKEDSLDSLQIDPVMVTSAAEFVLGFTVWTTGLSGEMGATVTVKVCEA